MEIPPKNMKDKEQNGEQLKEEAKKAALEKVRQKATIVNIEEIAEAEARKGADAYMTEDKASGLKKWWKHTVAEGFYRQREYKKVQKEIKETGNIYTRRIGDDPTKPAHESTAKGITDRFKAEYEDSLILAEGEKRKFLDDKDQDVTKVKTDLKNLLDSYAMGNIDDETFNNSKKGIIDSLKEKEDLFKGADNYADNLFEIAQNAKIAYEHGVTLGELDYDLGMIIGKAKSSLKTETHFNWIDKGIDKMKKNGVGKFISPTALSTAVGITYSVMTGVNALASTKAGQILGGIGSLGLTVGISTAFAAANESQRIADERKQHGLEMAEGGEYKAGSKRREQMAKYEYAMEKSTDLSQRLRDLMFEKDKDGNDVVKDIKEGDVQDIITCLGNIDARKSLNQTKNIDLISYSNIGNVEKESTDLTILTAQAKFELEKRVKTDLKNGLPQGVNSYEEYLESVTNTVKDSLLGGEKGIDKQDKSFRRHKAWRVTKKAAITATVGIIVGGTIRELMAIGSDHVQGLFNNPDGTTTVTPARHLFDIITGHQTHMDMGNSVVTHIGNLNLEVPEGVSVLQNGNGIDIIKGGQVIDHFIPKLDANGALDPEVVAKLAHEGILSSGIHNVINTTQEISTDANGWIQNHPGETIQVHHVHDAPFLDNNTPSVSDAAHPGHMLGADGNELGMRWGGPNGSGVNANGDAILNISHMDAIHSVHGNVSVDIPTEMHNGNLMALVYLNGGGQGIPVEVQPNGDIIFDHNNPIMQQVFTQDAHGHMVNHAKVIELVQKIGIDKNGVFNIRGISAIVGEGLDKIKDHIPVHDDIVVNTIIPSADVQSILFVPTVSRKPLEPVAFGKKDNGEFDDNDNKEIKTVGEISKETEKDENGKPVVIVPIVDKEKNEKQEKMFEMTQEEYNEMYDDLKMLNTKIQSAEGIADIKESSFKSEYGKKRYNDLKHIQNGKPVVWNKIELQIIGDEMEGLLRNAKIVKKEKEMTLEEKEQMKMDIEFLNRRIQSGEGIADIKGSSFKSEYGKKRYNDLRHIQGEKPIVWNKEELEKIATEMEKILVGPRKIETNNIIKNTAETKTEDISSKIVLDSNVESVAIKSEKVNILDAQGNPINSPIKEKEMKLEDKIEETKKEIEKQYDDRQKENESNESNESSKEQIKREFTVEDLSKIGTEFESEIGTYKVIKVSKKGFFRKTKIEVIFKDRKGVETILSYNKKELEGELKKGHIKIKKVKEEK